MTSNFSHAKEEVNFYQQKGKKKRINNLGGFAHHHHKEGVLTK